MARRTGGSGRLRGARAVLAVLAAGALAAGTARGADEAGVGPQHPARWIEADAPIYLEVTRPEALADRLLDPKSRAALDAVPGYRKALEGDSYRKLRAVLDQLAGKLGTTWEPALRDLTAGGIVFAAEAGQGGPVRAILAVTPKDPALLGRLNRAFLDLARQEAASKGQPDPIVSKEYRGVTGYGTGPDGAYAIVGGSLVVARPAEALRAVIDRSLDGPKPGAGAVAVLADDPAWKARRAQARPDALAWGLARLDRLRALDPKKFSVAEKVTPQQTFLFGSWIEVLRKAPWVAASLTWTDRALGADLDLPAPSGGYPESLKGYVPPKGAGAPGLARPPGTILSLGLWRDLSALWEARAELFPPETVQELAKLDGVAGQFFGGRDFGTGVLGAFGTDWRLVVAQQDYAAMTPAPDVKLPAFALVADLKPDDEEFSQRLRVAFQSFVGLANLGAAQQKAPPLELGSETFEGVTIATTRYMLPKAPPKDGATVHRRHNFSPSAAQVGDHFILSSSVGLARDLVHALKSPAPPNRDTLVIEADGKELARLIDVNRSRLVMQNMLEKGHDKEQAEAEVGVVRSLVNYLGRGRLAVKDNAETVRVGLDFRLGE